MSTKGKAGYVSITSKTINVYKDGVKVGVYSTLSNAARATGVKVQNIYRVINGYKSTLNGYEFKVD